MERNTPTIAELEQMDSDELNELTLEGRRARKRSEILMIRGDA